MTNHFIPDYISDAILTRIEEGGVVISYIVVVAVDRVSGTGANVYLLDPQCDGEDAGQTSVTTLGLLAAGTAMARNLLMMGVGCDMEDDE